MNKDDLDIFRHLDKTPKNSSGLDLIKGLNDREAGLKINHKTRENVQLFAEEQFVRKPEYTEMRCEMPGLPRSTFLMVFSPDGQRTASTHGNHNIYVTDLRSGKNIKTLVGHPRTPWCIAFHPTSDQIVASGCLGGQVRIWDLSGGSEVWTTATQSVIASIAFHPNDRVLVIATFNEVYFWDWSHPEPFLQTATSSPREKVRYVAFDKLGHKLITGIANSPQTRWERARAPVPVPRQERCASPYRRRITQRLVSSAGNVSSSPQSNFNTETNAQDREPSSGLPERERRIALCYRDLVREYELLVHRYLQLYRPPTMIDRGTDPMEPNHYTSGTQTAESTSNDNAAPGPSGNGTRNEPNTTESSISSNQLSAPINTNPQPSTSHSQNLITPSRIFSVGRKPPSSIRGTQTLDSRKHKSDEEPSASGEKKLKRKRGGSQSEDSTSSQESPPRNEHEPSERPAEGTSSTDLDDQRVLVVNLNRLNPERLPSTVTAAAANDEDFNLPRYRAARYRRRISDLLGNRNGLPTTRFNNSRITPNINDDRNRSNTSVTTETPVGSTSRYSERFNEYIRATRERIAEFRRRNQTVLSTEASSDVTSQETTEGDGNLSSPTTVINNDRVVPGTNNQDQRADASESTQQNNVEELLSNIRRTAEEEVRNRILPIIRSVPPPDRPELIRLFENSREHVRMRFRQMYPVFLRRHCRRTLRIDSSTDSSSSENEQDQTNSSPIRLPPTELDLNVLQGTSPDATSPPINVSASTPSTERNFNTELEQLVTSLLTEIERSENEITTDGHTSSNLGATQNNSASTSSARTRPSRIQRSSNEGPVRRTPMPGESLENIFYSLFPESNRTDPYPRLQADYPPTASQNSPVSNSSGDPRSSYLNTDTRTTNSTIYTSSSTSPGQRRRFFSHRVSAFMPTRVNYTRTRFRRNPHYTWGSGRAERGGTDDYPFPSFHPMGPSSDTYSPENIGIGSMYSNIVQDLQSSLDDVRNIGASRPGETSDMLSSFSERLENIMNQSDAILRNLRTSMDMLPNTTEAGRNQMAEPRWNFNDPGFYVRDLRNETSSHSESNTTSDSSLHELIGSLHAVATDHTYPRNPNNPSANDNMSPLMTSLHLSLSHIQRQARLLRRQVENIERIDRAMVEVGQVQLLRQLIIELVRYINPVTGESRSAGVSSVRQMMAGTRISDSGPYESSNEDANAANRSTTQENSEPQPQPGTSSGTTSSTDQPSTSSGNTQQRRITNRKTYPPSRFARHYQRRPSIVHWFSRRYLNRFERGIRQCQNRSNGPRTTSNSASSSSAGCQPLNYSTIDASTVTLMTVRLRRLLTEQMRIFTRAQDGPAPLRSTGSVDLGEHILALRLHGCWLRMNRVLGNGSEYSGLRAMRSNTTAAVSQDGASRYNARHSLSLIVDGMSRHIEELGSSTFSNTMRMKIHCVLTLSMHLTELLILQIRDSIPPPSGENLDAERESLARRIDEICLEMLQNRVNVGSAQFTNSLRIMTVTMRHAHRTLDQTYLARRNAIMPAHSTDRRQLLGMINRCLRSISRLHPESDSDSEANPRSSTTSGAAGDGNSGNGDDGAGAGSSNGNESNNEAWYSTISDLITRYSDNRVDDTPSQPSTSRERLQSRDTLSSTNENSDEDPDYPEPEWYYQRTNTNSSNNSSLYRTNNVNLVQQNEPAYQPRWNVPSVQVNDVPVSEPSFVAQRLLPHRQRVSELRSNPRVGIFRPRFLHPLYANVNPFDADLDDQQREQIYDSDMIATVTPNHRIQAWDISNWTVPAISSSLKNVVVNECKIHNDASVDIATDGTILVTLLPSGGYLNVTNRLGIYSLRWETLGQCLYTTSFEQNAVSVSLSPLSRHLLVGFASRRVSIVPSDRWVMARIYKIEQKDVPGDRLPVLRDLEQQRESRINCIRWLPTSGQGLIYATNTGQLVMLS